MRKLFPLLLLICFTAQAQVRTYSDNASGTFVFGLDSYFYGESGTLDFSVGGVSVKAFLADGTVRTGDSLLESGSGDTLIGIHDFTGDKAPELMVARRSGNSVSAQIYTYASGTWVPSAGWKRAGRKSGCSVRWFPSVAARSFIPGPGTPTASTINVRTNLPSHR